MSGEKYSPVQMLANARKHYVLQFLFFSSQKCYFTAWFGADLFIVVERSKDITNVKLLPSLVAKISDVCECKRQ